MPDYCFDLTCDEPRMLVCVFSIYVATENIFLFGV